MTLIELIMVVVLLGTLMAVVVPRLGTGTLGRPGAAAVARRLALDLRYARSLAIAEGVNHYVGFDVSGSNLVGYTIYRKATPSDLVVESYRTFARGLTVTGSTTRAEFTPSGIALGGYTFVVSVTTQTHTVTVIAATGAAMVSSS